MTTTVLPVRTQAVCEISTALPIEEWLEQVLDKAVDDDLIDDYQVITVNAITLELREFRFIVDMDLTAEKFESDEAVVAAAKSVLAKVLEDDDVVVENVYPRIAIFDPRTD